jgi:excisionase family DNA binding protein
MNLETVVLEPVAVRLPTAARMLDCGVTKIHELIKAGKLETIQIGADRRVTIASVKRLVAPRVA